MEKIFFGEQGLTSTSANYIANLAKESYQNLESELDNISFVNASVSLMGYETSHTLKVGTSSIDFIPSHLKQIAKLKALIAWLREAIKAKETLIKRVKNITIDEFCNLQNLENPKIPRLTPYSESDYLATLSVKERNRYFYLDTICSTIGKYIHPNGKYSQERKYLADKINSPYAVDGHGRDANIYKYEPSIKYSEVDKLFFALQDKYRDFQAELNAMKYKIENEVLKENNKRTLEYEKLCEEYTNSSEAIRTKYNHYITQLVHEISEYKIVIPNDLQSTYEEVKKLGK